MEKLCFVRRESFLIRMNYLFRLSGALLGIIFSGHKVDSEFMSQEESGKRVAAMGSRSRMQSRSLKLSQGACKIY